MPADPTAEIKGVYNLVEEHFPIYESKVETQSITFYVEPKNRAVVGEEFGQLQKALKAQGFIAVFNYTGGEYIIQVVRNPVQQTSKPKKTIVNKVLLLLTFITTTLAGMMLWSSYDSTEMWSLTTAGMGALTFAVPLMAILGIHELGHYYAAKRHGLNASLPYFIPSSPPFGTFGAFISLREPMPDRKTLVDVGAAGPLCGFLVTIPVAIAGLYLTAQGGVVAGDVTAGAAYITIQPIYQLMVYLVPSVEGMVMHPMAFAAWVGFFVTAINLLPIGQLDGGHIARGLLGENAKYLAYAAFIGLLACVFLYDGWLLFALLVILIGIIHPAPLNNLSKIDKKTKAFGTITLLLLLVTFVPEPLHVVEADTSFEIVNENAADNAITFELVNTGNMAYDVNIGLLQGGTAWSYWLDGKEMEKNNNVIHLKQGETKQIRAEVYPDSSELKEFDIYLQSPGQDRLVTINASSAGEGSNAG